MRTAQAPGTADEAGPPAYERVLLKLSGESFGADQAGINFATVAHIAKQIAEVHRRHVEIAVVVGGGNILRGAEAEKAGMDRTTADHMGMLATIINGLALRDAIEKEGIPTRVQTALEIKSIAEPFIRLRATRHLEKGRVVIFAAGTGNPYFSTDSAAVLRALEVGAEAILMGKRVDGVYSADPNQDPGAEFLPELSYMAALERDLRVMDATAIALCKDYGLPIHVFNLLVDGNIERVVMGEKIGTIVH